MADGNNNTYIFILKFSKNHKTFLEFKWGSDCFKGCYTFFTRSDIISIIPLSEKKSWYIELFELCKTSKS